MFQAVQPWALPLRQLEKKAYREVLASYRSASDTRQLAWRASHPILKKSLHRIVALDVGDKNIAGSWFTDEVSTSHYIYICICVKR